MGPFAKLQDEQLWCQPKDLLLSFCQLKASSAKGHRFGPVLLFSVHRMCLYWGWDAEKRPIMMHWERREMVHHAPQPPWHPLRKPPRYPLRFQIFIQLLTWCQGTNLHQLFQKSDTTNRLAPEKSLQVFLLETNHRGIHELVNFCLQSGPCWFPICNANNPYGRFDVQEMFSLAK